MLQARVRNNSEWRQLHQQARERLAVEAFVAKDMRSTPEWHQYGWCDVCEKPSRFHIDWLYSDGDRPNFRERLVCRQCQLNTRQRLALRLLRETTSSTRIPSIYVYEQVTPLYRAIKEHFSDAIVTGSEYLGHDVVPGTYLDGIRHEDALHLSFDDESIDVVLSNDVYEHVPDIERALSEAGRVLRPGGVLIATVPFMFTKTTSRRARLVDGRVEHLHEPMFHENPLSEKGSLVFYDFGWDLLDICRAAGFSDAHFFCVHSFFRAYLGVSLGLTLIGTRGPA